MVATVHKELMHAWPDPFSPAKGQVSRLAPP